MKNKSGLSINDIAVRAGVSRSTVSRVLNQEAYVSQPTRQRVERVIEELNYTPDPIARMMITRSTQTIGFVVQGRPSDIFEDPHFYPSLLEGIMEATNKHGYSMMLWMENSAESTENFYNRIVQNYLMDGLIVSGANTTSDLIPRLVESGTKFVCLERPYSHQDVVNYVTSDNRHMTRTLVDYLVAKGRRRIGLIAGDQDDVDGVDRKSSYLKAMQDYGLPELAVGEKFSYTEGRLGAEQLLQHEVDAIIASSGQIALGALSILQEQDILIPEQVALISFDDFPALRDTNPPLTVVRQHIHKRAFTGTETLIELLQGKLYEPQQIMIDAELIIRGSS